jgi:hypothetical protein
VSFEADHTLVGIHKGCWNWKDIVLGDVRTGLSLSECQEHCSSTAGCTQYNYEPESCSVGDEVMPGQGSCCIFKEGCKVVDHDCWDLYEEASDTCTAVARAHKGCTNWEEIKIEADEQRMVSSMGECCDLCGQTHGCTSFNYADNDHCSGVQGRCMLFNGECQEEHNICWSLYNVKEAVDPMNNLPPEPSGSPTAQPSPAPSGPLAPPPATPGPPGPPGPPPAAPPATPAPTPTPTAPVPTPMPTATVPVLNLQTKCDSENGIPTNPPCKCGAANCLFAHERCIAASSVCHR